MLDIRITFLTRTMCLMILVDTIFFIQKKTQVSFQFLKYTCPFCKCNGIMFKLLHLKWENVYLLFNMYI